MIISQDNVYVKTIIFGLIWAIICFMFYNVANEDNENNKKDNKQKSNSNLKTIRFLIPEKYEKIGYPLLSFTFSSSIFLGLKLITNESGYSYQLLIPSIQLILLIHYVCLAFFWISLFNNKNQIAYFLSTVIFITVIFMYFGIININEDNISNKDIEFKQISKKPISLIVISILINFYLCVISMVKVVAENKKGFLSYFGEALLKFFNYKNVNQQCPAKTTETANTTKNIKKKN
ncbi:hypothetical protein BCR32DRAFT_296353 [Anaeromyces robustus]|uniref:Uncharacterized protein n=1 Tax=Anaeromyces robustus TaxID=1754192 RepID=A0A1Y1WRV3_9FUNG|nr:hypothetical protein BCR32DRAFT_296353 [Anaeromyces robustus]|eukprot:ORX76269.1 hypothetical protein BCR32DRAFT_296353 [Anaeromyces robustus]